MVSRSSTRPLDLAIGLTFLSLIGGIFLLVQRNGDLDAEVSSDVTAIAPELTVEIIDETQLVEVQQAETTPSPQTSEPQTPAVPLQEVPSEELRQEEINADALASEIGIDEAWDQAVQNPSIAGFRRFLEDYPKSNYTMRAQLKISQLSTLLDRLAQQCLQNGNKPSCTLYLSSTDQNDRHRAYADVSASML